MCKEKRSHNIVYIKVNREPMLTLYDSVCDLAELFPRSVPSMSSGGRADGKKGIPSLQCCEIEGIMVRFRSRKSPG